MATATEDRTRLDTLPRQVFAFWPTATASNPNDREPLESWLARRDRLKEKGYNGNGAGMPLGIAVKLWPEATASGSTDSSSSVATEKSAPLNPDFAEWLMGWPRGWTASQPLETDRFRQWLPLRGNSSGDVEPMSRIIEAAEEIERDGIALQVELRMEWDYDPGVFVEPCHRHNGHGRGWYCRTIAARREDTGEAIALTEREQEQFRERYYPARTSFSS